MASTGISAATFVPTTFADTPISSAGVVNAAGQITNQGNAITLRSAVIAANAAGGTNSVTLGAGTYQLTIPGTGETAASGDATIGDLDVLAPPSGTNTLTVQGAGAGSTTIQQTTGVDRVFDLHPVNVAGSITFNLNGVTVTGGVSTSSAGAILAGRAGDVTALTNCVFSGNTAATNGGAISQSSANASHDLTITNCVFNNNTATSGGGGAVNYSGRGTVTITNSLFSNNNSGSVGGAVNVSGGSPGGTYNIFRSAFVNNAANTSVVGPAFGGGAIASTQGVALNVNFNRFTGNTAAGVTNGKTITTGGGTVSTLNANNNWWGVNTGPTANDVLGDAGVIAPSPWLQLRNSASPTTINVAGTSNVTADIFGLNTGGATAASNLTGLPAFPPSGSVFGNAQKGTIPAGSVQFVNGTAGVVFTGTVGGLGGVDAVADSQTITAPITVTALTGVTINVPAGISYTFNSQTVTGSQTFQVAPGNYTLSTTTPQSLGAGSRAVFASWSDAGAISHSVTVGASALTITGSFTTQYQLTTVAGAGGTVTPATGTFFDSGTVVNVSATANAGFVFNNWTGPVANASAASTTVLMDAAKSITANFTALTGVTIRSFTGTTATGSGVATVLISTVDGGANCGLLSGAWVPVSSVPQPPPSGLMFPHGLLDFQVGGCAPGSTITLTISYPQPLPSGTGYWKYGPTPSNSTARWYVVPSVVSGNTLTFSITDGRLGDDDLSANGTIIDAGGPGAFAEPVPTPGLNQWLLALLMMSVLAYGLCCVKRGRSTRLFRGETGRF